MQTFEEWHDEYFRVFDTYLPLMMMGGTEQELIEIIKECLKTGEPLELDYEEGVYY